mmetsp:Transcript_20439/g.42217  ORF Transcript_20439/g.42217 Transcript_20439/m.42217 type:complete len:255 (-) Transcript_20439:196-960(-)
MLSAQSGQPCGRNERPPLHHDYLFPTPPNKLLNQTSSSIIGSALLTGNVKLTNFGCTTYRILRPLLALRSTVDFFLFPPLLLPPPKFNSVAVSPEAPLVGARSMVKSTSALPTPPDFFRIARFKRSAASWAGSNAIPPAPDFLPGPVAVDEAALVPDAIKSLSICWYNFESSKDESTLEDEEVRSLSPPFPVEAPLLPTERNLSCSMLPATWSQKLTSTALKPSLPPENLLPLAEAAPVDNCKLAWCLLSVDFQ